MSRDEAIQLALGYAWAWEDATGIPTPTATETPGTLAFAEAFAQGQDEFNRDLRHVMISVQDAYRTWTQTHGGTIFPAYAGR